MFNSILVVCTGNICRSPIGERYLRNIMPDKIIDSAGTGALVGHDADISALKIAAKHGISLIIIKVDSLLHRSAVSMN